MSLRAPTNFNKWTTTPTINSHCGSQRADCNGTSGTYMARKYLATVCLLTRLCWVCVRGGTGDGEASLMMKLSNKRQRQEHFPYYAAPHALRGMLAVKLSCVFARACRLRLSRPIQNKHPPSRAAPSLLRHPPSRLCSIYWVYEHSPFLPDQPSSIDKKATEVCTTQTLRVGCSDARGLNYLHTKIYTIIKVHATWHRSCSQISFRAKIALHYYHHLGFLTVLDCVWLRGPS